MPTDNDMTFLRETLEKWQAMEDETVKMTNQMRKKSDNPLVQSVLQILERDSTFHHKMQQMLIDSLGNKPMHLTPEDMAMMSEILDTHHQLEKDVIQMGQDCLSTLGASNGMVLQRFVLNYLIRDERKHDLLLDELSKVKSGMYPYGG